MSTENLWRTLRRGWWKVAVGAVVGALLALLVMQVAPKQYEATAQVLIQATPTDPNVQAATTSDPSVVDDMMPTYVAIASSDTALDSTRSKLSPAPSRDDLREQVTFVADEEAPTIMVTAHAGSAQEATNMAGAAAQTLVEQVANTRSGSFSGTATVIQQAEVPSSPVSPDPMIFVPAGIIIGILVVLVWLLVRGASSRGAPAQREEA